jgi:hypothetical protein
MEEKRVVTGMKNIQIPNNAGFLLDFYLMKIQGHYAVGKCRSLSNIDLTDKIDA